MLKRMALVVMIGLLSGCASTPNVIYSYYPSDSNSIVTVTQTVDCNSAKTDIVVASSASVNTVYFADYTKEPYSIEINKLDGTFADSDFTFNFFDDGRLKSINGSTTGQGETILKSAIALGTAVAVLGGGAPAAPKAIPECDTISKWGGGKPVTLNFTKKIDYKKDTDGLPHNLEPVPDSAGLYSKLSGKLHKPQVTVMPPHAIKRSAYANDKSDNIVPLNLQDTENIKLDVSASGLISSYTITIPGKNTFTLPIPKAALFGKQSFALTLSEAGAITQIEYGKTTGAAGPLNIATSAATSAAPESDATKAAEVKGKADLIVQQQRLVHCLSDPAKCQ